MPPTSRTGNVQRYQAIGSHEAFADKQVEKSLPASWGTLYVLTGLSTDELTQAIAEGVVSPATPRNKAEALVKLRLSELIATDGDATAALLAATKITAHLDEIGTGHADAFGKPASPALSGARRLGGE